MDPVGYKRVNKKTGREIAREQIVKGVEYEDGQYVVLSDKEIADAYPKTTQTIEIETFVPADSIPFVYLERPYYVAPINAAARSTRCCAKRCSADRRVGVGARRDPDQAAPGGAGARWARGWCSTCCAGVPTSGRGKTCRCRPRARSRPASRSANSRWPSQLVEDMSSDWDPDEFKDSFKDEIMRLVDQKVEAGRPRRSPSASRVEEKRPPRRRSSTSPSCCSAACARAARRRQETRTRMKSRPRPPASRPPRPRRPQARTCPQGRSRAARPPEARA